MIGALRKWVVEGTALAGIPRLLHRKAFKDRVAILMYHGVVEKPLSVGDWCFLPADRFRRQIEYLRREFDVVPLATAVERLSSGRVTRPTAAITFDDGYQNNYDVAFPILKKARLPAIVFLTTGLIDTEATLWFCRLVQALGDTTEKRLHWSGTSIDIGDMYEREKASRFLQQELKNLSPEALGRELRKVLSALRADIDKPVARDSPFRMLDSESVRAMAASGLIEFGAHTHGHAILSRLTPEKQQEEIERSVRLVESMSGSKCRFFAYPNGRKQDYDEASKRILRSLGMTAAVTTVFSENHALTPLLELGRYGVGADLSEAGFIWLAHHATARLGRLRARLKGRGDGTPPYPGH